MLKLELDEADLKELILNEIKRKTNLMELTTALITIEVKSKQNYKSEWEVAAFRAKYIGEL